MRKSVSLMLATVMAYCVSAFVPSVTAAAANNFLHGFEGYYFNPDYPDADYASSWMGEELTINEITDEYVSFDYERCQRGRAVVYTEEKAYFTNAYTAVANGTFALGGSAPEDATPIQYTLTFSNNSIRLDISNGRTIRFQSNGLIYPENFDDVTESHWAYSYITYLTDNRILAGYEDGSFRPDSTVTRAEWSKMLVTAFNIEPTPHWQTVVDLQACDIFLGDWYTEYMFAAEPYLNAEEIETPNQPIILYHPMENATREDVAESLAKVKLAQGYSLSDEQTLPFSDPETVTDEGKPYISAALEFGLISGFEDNTFRGQAPVTRAEAAALLYRAVNL